MTSGNVGLLNVVPAPAALGTKLRRMVSAALERRSQSGKAGTAMFKPALRPRNCA
jgi:hypothetical protein